MRAFDRSWERPRPTSAQVRADVVLGVVAALLSVVSVELLRSASAIDLKRPMLTFTLFAVAGVLLAIRRSFPLTMLAAESVVFIVVGEMQPEIGIAATIQVILFASLYSAWAWSRRPRELMWLSAAVIVAMFGWLVWAFVHDFPDGTPSTGLIPQKPALIVYTVGINVAYFFGAIAWGQSAYRSARRAAEIERQAERERDAQERERDTAVRDERVRIARDLHDVVAHHVSGIGVQAAGASRVLTTDPEGARSALGRIEQASRDAVRQMHQLVGLLRDDAVGRGGRDPQPGLADLHTLATGDGNPTVTFRESGEQFPVPPTVQLSLFRVAQEAVTNVRRHARASTATVVLRHLDEPERAVEIEITDDGRSDSPAESDGGFGLSGIRERVSMHGGSSEIGPRPQGGFRVRVRIPVEE